MVISLLVYIFFNKYLPNKEKVVKEVKEKKEPAKKIKFIIESNSDEEK